jgi:hypothetical protein
LANGALEAGDHARRVVAIDSGIDHDHVIAPASQDGLQSRRPGGALPHAFADVLLAPNATIGVVAALACTATTASTAKSKG